MNVVLLSGGLDSTTCLALVLSSWPRERTLALSFSYGQKHLSELKAAEKVAEFYGVAHRVIDITGIYNAVSSILTDPQGKVPEVSYQDLLGEYQVSPLYVPFRNGILISIAAAVAYDAGGGIVYCAVHKEDASGTYAYPDCSDAFTDLMAQAVWTGTGKKVSFTAPFVDLTKAGIVGIAANLGAPLHLTHSCYNGVTPACGKCPTCVSRINAFKTAGYIDPVSYQIEIDWGDCQPFPTPKKGG